MDNVTRLLKYCEDHLIHYIDFSKYAEENPNFVLPLLPEGILGETLNSAIKKNRIRLMFQKVKNKSFADEIVYLQKSLFKVVGLKGFYLQAAYYPPEFIRLFGDIDIITKKRDGYPMYKQLKKAGFQLKKTCSFFDNKLYMVGLLRSKYFQRTYHVELQKQSAISSHTIELELHGNINRNRSSLITFNVNRMIDDAIQKTYNDTTFYIFKPEDNLLYLMYHTMKHLSYTSFSISQEKRINLQSFYDVAQIMSIEVINWELFDLYVKEYNIAPFVSLFVKIFDAVFPQMIPTKIKDSVDDFARHMDFIWKPIYSKVITMQPSDLIIGNYQDAPDIENCFNIAAISSDPGGVWLTYCQDSVENSLLKQKRKK